MPSRSPRVVVEPRIQGGEPTIEGTRVTVRAIVVLFEQYQDAAHVYRALPTLPPGAVDAALAYYRRHRDEIERYIEANEAEDVLANSSLPVS